MPRSREPHFALHSHARLDEQLRADVNSGSGFRSRLDSQSKPKACKSLDGDTRCDHAGITDREAVLSFQAVLGPRALLPHRIFPLLSRNSFLAVANLCFLILYPMEQAESSPYGPQSFRKVLESNPGK